MLVLSELVLKSSLGINQNKLGIPSCGLWSLVMIYITI